MAPRSIALQARNFRSLAGDGLQCEVSIVGHSIPPRKFTSNDGRNLAKLILQSDFFQLLSVSNDLGNKTTLVLFVEIPGDDQLAVRVQKIDWELTPDSFHSSVRIVHLPETPDTQAVIDIDQPVDVAIFTADSTSIDEGSCTFCESAIRNKLASEITQSRNGRFVVASATKARLATLRERYWEVLILIAHGSKPTPAAPSGMIWLNSEVKGTGEALDPEDLANELLKLGDDCPPVVALLSCHGANPGNGSSSFAAELFSRVPGIKILLAYTESIPPREVIERTLDMSYRLSTMTIGESLFDLISYDGILGALPLRVYSKSMNLVIEKTRRSNILVTDHDAVKALKATLTSATPPILVLGSGCFNGYHRKVEKVAEDYAFPFLGMPRRDPADVSLSGGRSEKEVSPANDPFLWRTHIKHLYSEEGLDSDGTTPLSQTRLIDLLVDISPPIIINLSRGQGVYETLKRMRREVKVLFTSPKVPIRDMVQEKNLEEYVLEAERRRISGSGETLRHLLIQPFGMAEFNSSRELLNGLDNGRDLFDQEDARRFEMVQRGQLKGRNRVVCASQVHLLEWLHTVGDTQPNSRGLPTLITDRMKDVLSGLVFFGVSSELLETKVFLTWLSAELVHRTSSKIERLYVVQSMEAYGQGYFQDSVKARRQLSDLIRYYLAIEGDRILYDIATDLDSVLRELTAPSVTIP